MAILTKAANEPLAFSEVQAFFGRLYPTGVHSFAIENADGIRLSSGNTAGTVTAWSTSAYQFYPGLADYVAQDPSLASITITRDPGTTRQLNQSRMDARIRVNTFTPTTAVNIGIEILQSGNAEVIWTASASVEGDGIFDIVDNLPDITSLQFNNNLIIRAFAENVPANEIIVIDVVWLQLSLITTTRFQRNTEPLSVYAREPGGIVPSMSGGAATYPTGGIAVEDLGTVTIPSNDSTEWPDEPAGGVTVQGDTGWTHDIATTTGNFNGAGQLVNGTGGSVNVGNTRIYAGITFSNFQGDATTTIQPFFWNRNTNVNQQLTINKPLNQDGTVNRGGSVTQEFELTFQTGTAGILINNGGAFDFIIFDNQGDRPYDATVDYLRWNLSGTGRFDPTGGGGTEINQTVSDIPGEVRLSQLRNVDDGREDNQQQTGGSQ